MIYKNMGTTIASGVALFTVSLCICVTSLAHDEAGQIAPANAVARISPSAIQVVAHLDAGLLAIMKAGKSAGYRGRYRLIRPIVVTSFDMPFIARTVVGPYWSKFSAAQKQTLINKLLDLTAANYAGQFTRFSGEAFTGLSKQQYRFFLVVRTLFVEPDGTRHKFDYLLHEVNDHWLIMNVVADGVSNLSLKQAQYIEILNKEGFKGLISHITHDILALEQSGEK